MFTTACSSVLLVLLSLVTLGVAAKTHGRQIRRERSGYTHAVFGGDNPPFVAALWRRDRRRLWTTAAATALTMLLLIGLGHAPRVHDLVIRCHLDGARRRRTVRRGSGWAPAHSRVGGCLTGASPSDTKCTSRRVRSARAPQALATSAAGWRSRIPQRWVPDKACGPSSSSHWTTCAKSPKLPARANPRPWPSTSDRFNAPCVPSARRFLSRKARRTTSSGLMRSGRGFLIGS